MLGIRKAKSGDTQAAVRAVVVAEVPMVFHEFGFLDWLTVQAPPFVHARDRGVRTLAVLAASCQFFGVACALPTL